ncbi:hypothetical protein [Chromobacterium amazonense]|uniref:hypothetical protein n=1 Tax=Chromobacterium amazonense TaxID=1382803 RepID=UPI0011142A58|nr:hypothetical protein [Chromobacterium amazonense]
MSKSIKKYAYGLAMIALTGVSHVATAAPTTEQKTFAVSYNLPVQFTIVKKAGNAAIAPGEAMVLTGTLGAQIRNTLELILTSNLGKVKARLAAGGTSPRLIGATLLEEIPLTVKVGPVTLNGNLQDVAPHGAHDRDLIIESERNVPSTLPGDNYVATVEIDFVSEL